MTPPAVLLLILGLVGCNLGTALDDTLDNETSSKLRIFNDIIRNNYVAKYKEKIDIDNSETQEKVKFINNHQEENIVSGENNDNPINLQKKYIHAFEAQHERTKMRHFTTVSVNSNSRRNKRIKRDNTNLCEGFMFENKNQMTIVSPKGNDTENYARGINCATVISGDPGTIVTLSFVDMFHLEDHSECSYDFLEVRDGMYGYAHLLGKLCGEVLPDPIISTGPHLWLKFHSDDTIEFEGFRIDINIASSPTSQSIPESCNKTLTGWYGTLNTTELSIDPSCKDAARPLDHLWTISTPPDTKIFLNFTAFKLVRPNDCEDNVLQVYGSVLEFDSKLSHYCGSIADSVTTKDEVGNIMYVRLFTSKIAKNSSFVAKFAAFVTLNTDGDGLCPNGEEELFNCEDNTCISNALKCDGKHAECRLKTDEDPSKCAEVAESIFKQPRIQIILSIFSIIVAGMMFGLLFKCIRKLHREHKQIKEHLRLSREDGLDSIGSRRTSGRTIDAGSFQSQDEDELRASLEQENLNNENFKRQRTFSQRKPTSIDTDYNPDDDDDHWRREIDRAAEDAAFSKYNRREKSRRGTISSRKQEALRRQSTKNKREVKVRREQRDVSVEVPDTKEFGCQTRDSLFQTGPSPEHKENNTKKEAVPEVTGNNSQKLSTPSSNGAASKPSSQAPDTNKSEVTIEILKIAPTKQDSNSRKGSECRPISNVTTRSAPDVIFIPDAHFGSF